MAKKATKKVAKKTTKKVGARSASYNLVDELLVALPEITQVNSKGEVRIKKTDLKRLLDDAFQQAAKNAAGGERIRVPFIGTLSFKEVKPRKAGKGVNPFTGEEIMIKARPASRKPRFTFNKASKEIFANKRNW